MVQSVAQFKLAVDDPVKITIERNTATDSFAETYPYIARIEIISATKDVGTVYQVPIFVRYHGLNKTFGVDICGFRLEAANPHHLIDPAHKLIRGLVNASRLPNYVFVARRARAVFPVYTIDDEVFAVTPVGPVFRHVELAKVREYLTDFLHEAKILGEHGKSDKLHVRGVSSTTLGLRRPVFYLKKRVAGETDFWAPVFQAVDGRSIYAYAASARREAVRHGNDVVLQLHTLVAEALQADGRLSHPFDLRPDRLMPGYWAELRAGLTPQGQLHVGQQEIALYEVADGWFETGCVIGVETRTEEERYGLFLGRDAADVAQRIERDFARRGMLD